MSPSAVAVPKPFTAHTLRDVFHLCVRLIDLGLIRKVCGVVYEQEKEFGLKDLVPRSIGVMLSRSDNHDVKISSRISGVELLYRIASTQILALES